MRLPFSALAALLATVSFTNGQTSTSCNPTLRDDCPVDPALGTTFKTDFTQPLSSDWQMEAGTSLSHDDSGTHFTINSAADAPTIISSKYIFFGEVNAIVRAAPGAGIISSVILQSDDLDEIDLEWVGSQDNGVQTNFFGKGNTTTYDRGNTTAIASPVEDWYQYTIQWTDQSITWYINGSLIRTVKYDDPLALGGKNYPQTPMRVKIGSWVGCPSQAAAQDPKTAGTCSWAGGPADWSKVPYTMLVKSVTVQDYGCASEYKYGDMSGSWQSIQSIGSCGSPSSSTASSTSTSVHHTKTSDVTTSTTTDATRSAPNHDKTTSSSDSSSVSTSPTYSTSPATSATSTSGDSPATTTSPGDSTNTYTYATSTTTGHYTAWNTTSGTTYPYSSGAYTGTGGTGTGLPSTFASSTTNTVSSTTGSSSQTVSPITHPGSAISLNGPHVLDSSILALCLALGYLML